MALANLLLLSLLAGGAWWAAQTLGDRVEQGAVGVGVQRVQVAASTAARHAENILGDAAALHDLAQQWVDVVARRDAALRGEIERQMTREVEAGPVKAIGVAIIGVDGRLRWAGGSDAAELSLEASDPLPRHGDGGSAPVIGRPAVGLVSGEAVIPVAASLSEPDGSVAGLAMVFVRHQGLARELAMMTSLPGETLAILRRNGDVLASSAERDSPVGSAPSSGGFVPLPGAAGAGSVRAPHPVTGRDVIMAWAPVGQTGLVALASLETEWILRDAHALRFYGRLAAGAVAGIGVLALLAFLFWCRGVAADQAALIQRSNRAAVERLHAGLPAIIFVGDVQPDGTARKLYRGGDIEHVTGWPPARLHSMASLEPLSDYGATTMAECFRRLLREGAGSWEWRMRRADGSWSWMRTSARVVEYRGDGSAEIVGHAANIDRERAAEARAMVSARLASLGEMASSLAHELRQPLAALSLAAEVGQIALLKGDSQEALARLEAIVVQVERAHTVMEHLRRFARGPSSSDLAAPVSLRSVVEGTLALTGAMLREALVETEIALGEPPPVVLGDQVAMEQVLMNLVVNARDALATLPCSSPRRLRISAAADRDAGVVHLRVADNGGGIPPTVLARLFEPFVTTKDAEKGTGLGLSICLGLVQAMGGAIEGHNEAGGAVFILTLKAAGSSVPRAFDRLGSLSKSEG